MRARASAALSLAALAVCVLAVGFSAAVFTDVEQNPQTVSSVADWVAPSAETSAIVRSGGDLAGYVKAGGAYYVYANVADSGNPASGIASVKANVSSVTSGQTSVSLVAGSYSAAGVSYDYRSAQLTAGSNANGTKSYSLTLVDSAKNSDSQSFSVAVFKDAFEADGFSTNNVSGGTSGKPEKGDAVTFELNREPNPASIVSGWDGSGTKSVTVSISGSSSEDTLSVSGANIGSVALKGDYASSTISFSGSSLSLDDSEITIVLGTISGTVKTDTDKTKPVWSPSTSIYDLIDEHLSSTGVTGGNARQF